MVVASARWKVAPTPTHLLHQRLGAWGPASAQGLGANRTNPCWSPRILSRLHSNLISCLFQPEWSFPNMCLYRGNPSTPCLKTA